jgi:hypothetical protein
VTVDEEALRALANLAGNKDNCIAIARYPSSYAYPTAFVRTSTTT